ncbi:hypothetical protein ANTQUA_LOCUS4463 [Anthophora quadrimaculata]
MRVRYREPDRSVRQSASWSTGLPRLDLSRAINCYRRFLEERLRARKLEGITYPSAPSSPDRHPLFTSYVGGGWLGFARFS